MPLEWLKQLFARRPPALDPLGGRGENIAAKHLRNLGYKILTRNYRCRFGEIDIVARDGKTLVFAEVKTRKEADPEPEAQVNHEKQRKISRCAELYLSRYGSASKPPVRFDIIAILWPRNADPIIRHITDAFGQTD